MHYSKREKNEYLHVYSSFLLAVQSLAVLTKGCIRPMVVRSQVSKMVETYKKKKQLRLPQAQHSLLNVTVLHFQLWCY